jgi:rod shape-determining protein MreD
MQTITIFLMMILLLFIQGKLQFFGTFDFVLPLIIAIAIRKSSEETLLYSFGSGFIQDILFAAGFINTLIKTVIGILMSFLKNIIVLSDDQMCSLFALIFTPISIIGSMLAIQYLNNTEAIRFPWFSIILSTIINSLLAPFFYSILNRISIDE